MSLREFIKQKIQDAADTFFDNTGTDFVSDNVQDALTEVRVSASPGFSFGKSGNSSAGTWLLRAGGVPSNKTGYTIGLTNAKLTKINVGSEDAATYDVTIYQHDGNAIALTTITTVSVVASREGVFSLDLNLSLERQIAVQISSGSVRNVGVDVQITGDNT